MTVHSRRQFLGLLGAGTLFFPGFLRGQASQDDFDLIVVGDSLISGQGVKEEDKFYYLTKEFLQNEVFGSSRTVQLRNYSHSGSNVFLNGEEKAAMTAAGRSVDRYYHQEVNFSFPSIFKQIETASENVRSAGGDPLEVELIMVSGGITNITVREIIDPFSGTEKLRRQIKQFCNGQMLRFFRAAHKRFPRANILVIGYYPMISPKSSTGMIYNAVLELYKFPGPVKPVMNNILTKQFFKILHHKMNKKSRVWAKESSRELQKAIATFNDEVSAQKAFFVPSPINESNCFGTKRSLLWKMAKKGRAEDDLYDVRRVECSLAIADLKNVDLDFKVRFCELSGLGHPNIEGSKAYAESIKAVLKPLIPPSK